MAKLSDTTANTTARRNWQRRLVTSLGGGQAEPFLRRAIPTPATPPNFSTDALLWYPAKVLYIVNALTGGPANATRQKYTNQYRQ